MVSKALERSINEHDQTIIRASHAETLREPRRILFCYQTTEYVHVFLDEQTKICRCKNYLAPGVSYEKYLKAYGCSVQKGHFPYEYIDDLQKLEEHSLPPQAAFFSRLKNEGISGTDYALCQEAWRSNRMTTMRDFLVFYNNRDVVEFLECIDQQFAFYQQQNIDMFKDGISVPSLTLLYLFNDLPPNTFSQSSTRPTKIYIISSKTTSSVGQRSFSTDITNIRAGEMCRSVVGYDANALYLWALMQDMPCGGTRVDVKRNSSNHNKPNRMDRWPCNG